MQNADIITRYIKIAPPDVCYLRFILESYEGILAATSVVPKETIMAIMISPDFAKDADEIINNLKDEVNFEEVEDLSPYKERLRII